MSITHGEKVVATVINMLRIITKKQSNEGIPVNLLVSSDEVLIRQLDYFHDNDSDNEVVKVTKEQLRSFDKIIKSNNCRYRYKNYELRKECLVKRNDRFTVGSKICVIERDDKYDVVDLNDLTQITKFKLFEYFNYSHENLILQIMPLSSSQECSTMNYSISTNDLGEVVTNIDDVKIVDPIKLRKSDDELKINFKFENSGICKPNDSVVVDVEVLFQGEHLNVNYTFDLEEVCGYIPNKRLDIKNGYGSFKVFALCLQDGDNIVAKINKKNYTGYAQVEIPVKTQ